MDVVISGEEWDSSPSLQVEDGLSNEGRSWEGADPDPASKEGEGRKAEEVQSLTPLYGQSLGVKNLS